MTLVQQVRRARNAGTPVVAIVTSDQYAVVARVRAEVVKDAPAVQWDCTRGLRACNPAGDAFLRRLTAPRPPKPGEVPQPPFMLAQSVDFATTLDVLEALPEDGCVFAFNANLFVEQPAVRQGIANLRDVFKQNGRTLVLLGAEFRAPLELTNDVVVLDDPLPSEADVAALVRQQFANYGLPQPGDDVIAKAVDALLGLSAFAVEQVAAMCMTKAGLDFDALWARKRAVIAQTPGLSVWTGGETFDAVGGNGAIKALLTRLCQNPAARPRAIVWIDEIEKTSAAGAGATDHEVARDARAALLGDMQDTKARGVLLVGVAGSGKSLIAKALGATFGIPVIRFDLGAMQGSLVGQSQQMVRTALKVVHAIGQNRVLWVATSNDLSALAPELIERFTLGTFYFDLPTAEERAVIWALKCAEYGVDPDQPRPDDEGMVGRNIEAVCRYASDLQCSLVEAAVNVVPFGVKAAETVERLRAQADGNWLSASRPGVYRRAAVEEAAWAAGPAAARRKVVAE